jgi:hypothetical protein
MVALAPYDQRFVRRLEDRFRTASSAVSLCSVCGDAPRCHIKRGMDFQSASWAVESTVSACGVFMPVLTFKDDTGLSRTFNTFRRGPGWYRRVNKGTRVRFYATYIDDFVGEGQVVEQFRGPLGHMLEQHAAMNHLMRDLNAPDASAQLQRILIALYGRNYAAPDAEYSVIYCEAKA